MFTTIKKQGRIVVRKSQNCTRYIEDLFSLFHPVVEIPYCVHFNGWRGFSKARYESLMLHVSLLDIGEGVLNTHFFLSKYYWQEAMENFVFPNENRTKLINLMEMNKFMTIFYMP